MGTRADFYVGRGAQAEWLGSVAWDGYPGGFDRDGLLNATTEDQFRTAVGAELRSRDDGMFPGMGWPWPWDTSATTDYAYAFDARKVYGSCFGRNWFDASSDPDDVDDRVESNEPAIFPNMKARGEQP